MLALLCFNFVSYFFLCLKSTLCSFPSSLDYFLKGDFKCLVIFLMSLLFNLENTPKFFAIANNIAKNLCSQR